MTITFAEFCNSNDKESWQGYSTAFRAGVRARLESTICRYSRKDFAAAWQRGYDAADQFLTLEQITDLPKRQNPASIRNQPSAIIKHTYGELVEDCECDNCMAKKMNRARRQEKLYFRINRAIHKAKII